MSIKDDVTLGDYICEAFHDVRIASTDLATVGERQMARQSEGAALERADELEAENERLRAALEAIRELTIQEYSDDEDGDSLGNMVFAYCNGALDVREG